ncbi:hypothetical protein [Methylobacter sp. S3L5C]|uniref:hypothetical protein n=1 Tax=Methylobacter sp. S3L5C TaxID=2839024 RepID=UPI001FAE20AD|nr:hypothetical protein [Methylobacter sp. S3L5C]UOA10467.1 hypothetical protein KKZ03_09670 [Methylobacter sp. S3L5C]
MTSRFDELFSPDRLRQNWQQQVIPVLQPAQLELNLDIQTTYHELQRLVAERFLDAGRLSVKFDELTEEIKQTFPLDATVLAVDAKQKEAIISMLEQLEELLWAMDLAKGGK